MHRKSLFAIAAVLWKTNRTKLNKMRTKIYEQNQTKLEKVAIKPQKKKTTKKHTTGLVAVFFSSYLHNEPNLLFHIMFNKSFLYVNTLSLFCSAYIQPPWALDFWGSA